MSIEVLSALRAYEAPPATGRDTAPLKAAADAFAATLDRADTATQGFAAGSVDTQTMVEAVAEAEMALQTAITVRDRIVGAYQEVLRMPL